MRRILLIVALLLTLALPAAAVDFEYDWPQSNTDGTSLTDLGGARVYVCAQSPCIRAQGTKTGPDISAPSADPPAGAKAAFSLTGIQGFVAVTAFDIAGNEGPESNTVPFDGVSPGGGTLRKK